MTYDPSQPTPIDVLRGMGRDTSNDAESELLSDAEYTAILSRYGVAATAGTDIDTAAFYRAAAETMRTLAIAIEGLPSSINAPQDGGMSWSGRTQSLRDLARTLDAKADALDAAAASDNWTLTVRSDFLTGAEVAGW